MLQFDKCTRKLENENLELSYGFGENCGIMAMCSVDYFVYIFSGTSLNEDEERDKPTWLAVKHRRSSFERCLEGFLHQVIFDEKLRI